MSTAATNAAAQTQLSVAGLIGEALALFSADPAAAKDRLHEALRLVSPALPTSLVAPGGLAAWQQREVLAFVADNLDRVITVETASTVARLSPSHFCRAFRSTFGRTFARHVLERRIARAKILLAESAEPIAQVALACGTADQSHFTRLFAREVGMTPLVYRRTHADPLRSARTQLNRPNPSAASNRGADSHGIFGSTALHRFNERSASPNSSA